jgi:Ni/Co efflux regulator RcnB
MKKLIAIFIAAAFALGISTAYGQEEKEKMPWENTKEASSSKEKTKKTEKKTDRKKVKKKSDGEKKTVKGKGTKKQKAEATK